MGKSPVTIRDVAHHASVSPSTVSLVLRNADTVHPRTRRQVEQAIGELGYRRRPVGRPAREARGFNIAIVYPAQTVFLQSERSTATRQWFHAIQEELRTHGHHLSFFGGQTRTQSDPLLREVLMQGQIDGIIFLGIDECHQDLHWAIEQNYPVVAINRRARHGEFSSVEVDNYGAGKQVVNRLVELGHQRIAMAPSSQDWSFNRDRREGFAAGMQTHGLEPIWIARGENAANHQDDREVCQQVIQYQVTALFSDSDVLAVRCINRLEAQGIQVPHQLSVVGFDNCDTRSSSGLRVASVGFDNRMVGQCTAEIIRKLIQRRPGLVNMTAMVQTRLMEHETLGPAPTHNHHNG